MKKHSSFRPCLESLEDRWNLAIMTWTGAVNNNWMTGGNWSVGNVAQAAAPAPQDDVVIPANKTVDYDPQFASQKVSSLTMASGSTLDLTKVGAKNLNLTVTGAAGNGSVSNIGAAGGVAAKIISNSANGNNAGLIFQSAPQKKDVVTLENATFTFNTNPQAADYPKLTFNCDLIITGGSDVTLQADTRIGDGQNTGVGVVNINAAKSVVFNTGRLTINAGSQLTLKMGKDFTFAPNAAYPDRVIVDGGGQAKGAALNVDLAAGNPKFKVGTVKEKNGGWVNTIKGMLGAIITTDGTGTLYCWSGSGVDSTGGTSAFVNGDTIRFFGDGSNNAGVELDGQFTFTGSSEYFCAYVTAMPNINTNIIGWNPTITTTPFSFAVNNLADGNGNASWVGTNDTMIFDVIVPGPTATPAAMASPQGGGSVSLPISCILHCGGVFVEQGGTLTVNSNITGLLSPGTHVLLIDQIYLQPMSIAFGMLNESPWSPWTPNSHQYGLQY